MDITTAMNAGTLAGQLQLLTNVVAGLQQQVAEGAWLSGTVAMATTSSAGQLSFPPMTVAESAQIINLAVSLFQARLATAATQLTAM